MASSSMTEQLTEQQRQILSDLTKWRAFASSWRDWSACDRASLTVKSFDLHSSKQDKPLARAWREEVIAYLDLPKSPFASVDLSYEDLIFLVKLWDSRSNDDVWAIVVGSPLAPTLEAIQSFIVKPTDKNWQAFQTQLDSGEPATGAVLLDQNLRRFYLYPLFKNLVLAILAEKDETKRQQRLQYFFSDPVRARYFFTYLIHELEDQTKSSKFSEYPYLLIELLEQSGLSQVEQLTYTLQIYNVWFKKAQSDRADGATTIEQDQYLEYALAFLQHAGTILDSEVADGTTFTVEEKEQLLLTISEIDIVINKTSAQNFAKLLFANEEQFEALTRALRKLDLGKLGNVVELISYLAKHDERAFSFLQFLSTLEYKEAWQEVASDKSKIGKLDFWQNLHLVVGNVGFNYDASYYKDSFTEIVAAIGANNRIDIVFDAIKVWDENPKLRATIAHFLGGLFLDKANRESFLQELQKMEGVTALRRQKIVAFLRSASNYDYNVANFFHELLTEEQFWQEAELRYTPPADQELSDAERKAAEERVELFMLNVFRYLYPNKVDDADRYAELLAIAYDFIKKCCMTVIANPFWRKIFIKTLVENSNLRSIALTFIFSDERFKEFRLELLNRTLYLDVTDEAGDDIQKKTSYFTYFVLAVDDDHKGKVIKLLTSDDNVALRNKFIQRMLWLAEHDRLQFVTLVKAYKGAFQELIGCVSGAVAQDLDTAFAADDESVDLSAPDYWDKEGGDGQKFLAAVKGVDPDYAFLPDDQQDLDVAVTAEEGRLSVWPDVREITVTTFKAKLETAFGLEKVYLESFEVLETDEKKRQMAAHQFLHYIDVINLVPAGKKEELFQYLVSDQERGRFFRYVRVIFAAPWCNQQFRSFHKLYLDTFYDFLSETVDELTDIERLEWRNKLDARHVIKERVRKERVAAGRPELRMVDVDRPGFIVRAQQSVQAEDVAIAQTEEVSQTETPLAPPRLPLLAYDPKEALKGRIGVNWPNWWGFRGIAKVLNFVRDTWRGNKKNPRLSGFRRSLLLKERARIIAEKARASSDATRPSTTTAAAVSATLAQRHKKASAPIMTSARLRGGLFTDLPPRREPESVTASDSSAKSSFWKRFNCFGGGVEADDQTPTVAL